MPTIFISYSRVDKPFVEKLARRLRRAYPNNSIWFDEGLYGGDIWWAEILEQIAVHDIFIYVLSNESVQSEYCQAEFQEATRLQKIIITVQARDRTQLTDGLSHIHYTDMKNGPDDPDALTDLIGAINKHVGKHSRQGLKPLWEIPTAKPHNLVEASRPDNGAEVDTPPLQTPAKELVQNSSSLITPTQNHKIAGSDFIPSPFEWIEIPSRINKAWKHRSYAISKYPITNAQYSLFVEARGYHERKWWTDIGWKARDEGWEVKGKRYISAGRSWFQPLYWANGRWNENEDEQPVIGVSWYEAKAFCSYLSDVLDSQITLPTTYQWLFAAQGDNAQVFPWGNDWDCMKCNNSVEPCSNNGITNVRQFENKGDSPFGVVDMAGNIGEWCLLDLDADDYVVNYIEKRPVKGGWWEETEVTYFENTTSLQVAAYTRDAYKGFRIVRNY
jgi:hypothetical protein